MTGFQKAKSKIETFLSLFKGNPIYNVPPPPTVSKVDSAKILSKMPQTMPIMTTPSKPSGLSFLTNLRPADVGGTASKRILSAGNINNIESSVQYTPFDSEQALHVLREAWPTFYVASLNEQTLFLDEPLALLAAVPSVIAAELNGRLFMLGFSFHTNGANPRYQATIEIVWDGITEIVTLDGGGEGVSSPKIGVFPIRSVPQKRVGVAATDSNIYQLYPHAGVPQITITSATDTTCTVKFFTVHNQTSALLDNLEMIWGL
jgi:hypothetical protein